MKDYSLQNKKAWEYNAYEFWVRTSGTPAEMAHARFFDETIRQQMPKCSYLKYTISEIINSIINSGFCLKQFDEHPAWTNEKIPGEFTAIAMK